MILLLIHNFYKSDHFGGEDLMFQKESALLKQAPEIKKIHYYSVHNDRAGTLRLISNLFFPLFHALKIRKLVKDEKIDIVHVHNDFPMLSLWIFRFLRKLECVRIQTLHNYRHWCITGNLFRKEKGICEDCIKKRSRIPGFVHRCYRDSFFQSFWVSLAYKIQDLYSLMNDADAFFCLSEHQKKKLVLFGLDEKKIHLKPNAVKVSSHAIKNSSPEFDLIYVGRIEESKGILKVLDSVTAETRRKISIIGHSLQLSELRQRYPEVNFIGKQPHLVTLSIIRKSRFLLQPSLCYETFGLTLIEAMSEGVPVIGFNIGTRGDFIKDKVNGFIINEASIDADLQTILLISDDSAMRKAALDTAARFQEEIITKKQVSLYQLLLVQKRSAGA